jgi:hypothetical protein
MPTHPSPPPVYCARRAGSGVRAGQGISIFKSNCSGSRMGVLSYPFVLISFVSIPVAVHTFDKRWRSDTFCSTVIRSEMTFGVGHWLQYILMYIDGVLILTAVLYYVQKWRRWTLAEVHSCVCIDGVLILAAILSSIQRWRFDTCCSTYFCSEMTF